LLLSYKALDVEQIGHVYEGLLEYTVQRLSDDTIGLVGTKKAKNPNVSLAELESAYSEELEEAVKLIEEITQRSLSAIRNGLNNEVDEEKFRKVLAVCGGDTELANRIRPFANLLRTDAWGDFIVYRANSFVVTLGADRRETGTHYTPKSLTESIVETTLEPVAYVGPAEGKQSEEWQLKSSTELLDLKICDPAMGSGAFLVQVCRWLSEKLVETWGKEADKGKFITVDGVALESAGRAEPMPDSMDERLLIARRLVAEKCLYGVDMNPLAVELAKLSIWLITLAKGRPFGFLDHNLRSGDSLLGLHKLEQLTKFSLHPEKKQTTSIFASDIESAVKESLDLRKQLRETPIRDIRDVQGMERLDQQARQKLEHIEHIANAMIGEALASGGNELVLQTAMDKLSTWAAAYLEGDSKTGKKIIADAIKSLSIEVPVGKPPRKPFHWALEFPEVFERGGFDGIIGNPPFLGGRRISSVNGDAYERSLKIIYHKSKGDADLCSYFFRRSFSMLVRSGCMGLLATNSISEGASKTVALQTIIDAGGAIYSAKKSFEWPGSAGVYVACVHIAKSAVKKEAILDGHIVKYIGADLDIADTDPPIRFKNGKILYSEGTKINGKGFIINTSRRDQLIRNDSKNAKVIRPYLNGKLFNNSVSFSPEMFVIDFGVAEYEDALQYEEPFRIVVELVKPYRDGLTRQVHESRFWLFWDKREAFYNVIRNKLKVLVCPIVTTYLSFEFLTTDWIYSHQLKIFDIQEYSYFAVMQSSIHEIWARKFSSTLGQGLRYSTSAAFDTFVFPAKLNQLDTLGKKYNLIRRVVMKDKHLGLTALYNSFHDSEFSSDDIQNLRELHAEMDQAVATAYGWDDLDLSHGFHNTEQGIRFTISEEARRDVLERLLKLNHERHEEEVKQGLHDIKRTKKNAAKISTKPTDQIGLFENKLRKEGKPKKKLKTRQR